jgi:hypothetical protein
MKETALVRESERRLADARDREKRQFEEIERMN